MTMIPEGTHRVRILSGATAGKDEKGNMRVRVNVQFLDGDHAGRRMTYDEQWNAKTSPYVTRSLKAIGWQGRTLGSVPVDVVDGIETTADVTHLEIKKEGPRQGTWFAKVRSLGGATPLAAPSLADMSDADSLIPGADTDVPF